MDNVYDFTLDNLQQKDLGKKAMDLIDHGLSLMNARGGASTIARRDAAKVAFQLAQVLLMLEASKDPWREY